MCCVSRGNSAEVVHMDKYQITEIRRGFTEKAPFFNGLSNDALST